MALTFLIKPESYEAFENETDQIEKCKDWGLLSEKATKTKTFYYKGRGLNLTCRLAGYVDELTAVITFDNEQQHCIHPAFLKEMQASTFSARLTSPSEDGIESEGALPAEDGTLAVESRTDAPEAKPVIAEATAAPPAAVKPVAAKLDEPPKEKKARIPKLQLPEEKVKMTAIIQEFTTVPNHFTEEEDEIIIYDEVFILEPAMEVGTAWSSHSATLKKLELAVGDRLTFDCKVVAKKLTKHPVPYKINNPAKIQKV